VRKFAGEVDVVTFEFENVPSATVEAAAEFVEVTRMARYFTPPKTGTGKNPSFLRTAFRWAITDLLKISSTFAGGGRGRNTGSPEDSGFGYDGKGQAKIRTEDDIDSANDAMKGEAAILEAFIDFKKEVSVVCARGQNGEFVHYGVIENDHANHILDVSTAPAEVSAQVYGRCGRDRPKHCGDLRLCRYDVRGVLSDSR